MFDSFGGFPKANDGILDGYLKTGNDNGWYVASPTLLRNAVTHIGQMLKNPTLGNRVHIIKGFFEQTVVAHKSTAPISILRLDGDLYSSTKVVLESLYKYVGKDGFTIIDDYHWAPGKEATTKLAKEATDDFRRIMGITSPLVETMIPGKPYWQK